MPELPEVETVRRGIAPILEGNRIERARAFRADLRWPFPERFAERLTGRTVLNLRRRSKYILGELDDGHTWLIHLGMSGRIFVEADRGSGLVGSFVHEIPASPRVEAFGPHDHVVVDTGSARLIYNDARRFGAMDLWPTADLEGHPLLRKLGPEPLGNLFNVDALSAALNGKTASIKAALLDQRVVSGLGNIYVCEALWRAKIHPARAAGSISRKRLDALVRHIRDVLAEAIEAGGSSLRDYRQADGELGYFQHRFSVYDREDEPCTLMSCPGVVRRLVQSGRSTFYCPKCQK
ncbi:MAG: bifunctional DNA-formamidopyrimidine glycosylase/DNA-(apurinic or apyrimidinic site) lyase [Pseudomonadota bacterium]